MINVCKCGCGLEVKSGNLYINGHNKRKENSTIKKQCIICGNTFKSYKHKKQNTCSKSCGLMSMALTNTGRKNTAESCKKISNSLLGNTNFLGHTHSEETKNKIRLKSKEQWNNSLTRSKLLFGITKSILSGKYTPQNNSFIGRGYKEDLGHFVRSTWEANIARVLNYLKINYEYESKKCRFETDYGIIIFDFYIPSKDIYLEPKGYISNKQKIKYLNFVDKYPKIAKKVYIIDGEVYNKISEKFNELLPIWERRNK